jgi:hypothetical protein
MYNILVPCVREHVVVYRHNRTGWSHRLSPLNRTCPKLSLKLLTFPTPKSQVQACEVPRQ